MSIEDIKMSDVKIYTKSVCPYCVNLKALLKELKISYEEIDLTNQQELREKISQDNNGWRTVPMVFLKEKFVGGFTDFKKIVDAGELGKYLG